MQTQTFKTRYFSVEVKIQNSQFSILNMYLNTEHNSYFIPSIPHELTEQEFWQYLEHLRDIEREF